MRPIPTNGEEGGFLGIECGATKSVSILADADGRCLDRLERKDPANLRLLDEPGLHRLWRGIADRFPHPSALGIGMAGVLEASGRERVRSAVDKVWPGIPCWVGNDLETAYAAASEEPRQQPVARVIVISGTGASCYGKKANGEEILTGGWGHLAGDHGSGYDIALRACQAVFLALDESGHWPALGGRFLGALQLNSPAEMIAWLGGAPKTDIAALAVEVFAAAANGDKTAKLILTEAAEMIARTATACARRLVKEGTAVEFVLTGSVLLKQPGFARQVERQLLAAWPRAAVKLLQREGAWGAVAMARHAWQLARAPAAARATAFDVRKKVAPPPVSGWIPSAHGLSPTEQRNPRSMNLHRMSLSAAIRLT